MIKALLVGINAYGGGHDLKGCVNDVTITRDILIYRYKVPAQNVRMLLDRRATASAIKERLNWLVESASDKDTLLFWFSGHGSQIPNQPYRQGNDYEPDRLDEILCPVDLDWWHRVVRDDDINAIIKKVKHRMVLVLDCCHSGSAARSITTTVTPRYIEPPPDVVSRFGANVEMTSVAGLAPIKPASKDADTLSALFDGVEPGIKIVDEDKYTRYPVVQPNTLPPNVIVITGCKDKQASSDAFFGNRYQGALSFTLHKALLQANCNITYRNLHQNVVSLLKQYQFSQDPQLNYADGSDIVDQIFLS